MLLEGQVFPGLAPSASLSAESGKGDKGLPPNSKKQSSPKSKILMVVIGEKNADKSVSSSQIERRFTSYIIYASLFPGASRL